MRENTDQNNSEYRHLSRSAFDGNNTIFIYHPAKILKRQFV